MSTGTLIVMIVFLIYGVIIFFAIKQIGKNKYDIRNNRNQIYINKEFIDKIYDEEKNRG